eukprot:gnl/TRDRNA2_/TRDRNA2_163986_c0_seq1.p3 gnl/TRDRNA2_/TRDRNA2_163986_c0~~gnl/TRDRNA2_/TRDRNA2_163986_c0_seq1.p3  ORF type:complete len:254 (-),score=57.90 gnl/TRDRNA2_/TRDRNA2_163986_c0_seq1:98-859(-)
MVVADISRSIGRLDKSAADSDDEQVHLIQQTSDEHRGTERQDRQQREVAIVPAADVGCRVGKGTPRKGKSSAEASSNGKSTLQETKGSRKGDGKGDESRKNKDKGKGKASGKDNGKNKEEASGKDNEQSKEKASGKRRKARPPDSDHWQKKLEAENRHLLGDECYSGKIIRYIPVKGWGLIEPDSPATLPQEATKKMDEALLHLKEGTAPNMLYFREPDVRNEDGLKLVRGAPVRFQVYVDDKGAGACAVIIA